MGGGRGRKFSQIFIFSYKFRLILYIEGAQKVDQNCAVHI